MFTVSVVIPTFNRDDFIEKCVISVLQQSKKPNEIIVVDDGSNDRTWSALKKLGFSAPGSRKHCETVAFSTPGARKHRKAHIF